MVFTCCLPVNLLLGIKTDFDCSVKEIVLRTNINHSFDHILS